MVMIYLLAALAGLVAYICAARFGRVARTVIALLVFIVPSLAVTALMLIVGDKAPPGSVAIDPRDVYPGRAAENSGR